MRNLWWICWYLWEGLPTLFAFPIDSTETPGTKESWSAHWEHQWHRYAIGTLGLMVLALTLAGCLCCRRQRRPKGFQDDAGNGKEFKDGSTAGTETTVERVPSSSLELEVSRIVASQSANSKIQFDALPHDRTTLENRVPVKPKPPSPSLFFDSHETEPTNHSSRSEPLAEWFDDDDRHVPRERLKYHREIGRGWFGKVVEGTTDGLDRSDHKIRGVVVRILTEEATTSEKAWFLGEATPYLKLRHPNILKLLGSCLETDPYLLLFESCPTGDLKSFLRGNRDKGTCATLSKENVPVRMARDIANALEHMHDNGFAHTDLSARNCLVSSDLSIKLGDYGIGVEKYPDDYYVVGDRALPIRWSAPESLDCTETTIETRAITPRANIWSYAVLLWEMATWGERPYDNLGDEQVIEIIFSPKTTLNSAKAVATLIEQLPREFVGQQNFRDAIEAAWKFLPEERASLETIKHIVAGKPIEDFEKRWENLKPNGAAAGFTERDNRSASLQDLRGSVDSELWPNSSANERMKNNLQFRLGPDEPVKNQSVATNSLFQESGSETEEESWRGRVERGAYTEKVKQKSKSVADLMILVHIDSDSDAEISLGPQIGEKIVKKRLPASGSDGDLRSHVIADEFDQALRKLREPSVQNSGNVKITKDHSENPPIVENHEKPKLLTLVHQGQTPILRLSFGSPENVEKSTENPENLGNQITSIINQEKSISSSLNDEKCSNDGKTISTNDKSSSKILETENLDRDEKNSLETLRIDGPVLRLVSKGDPELPLLRYVPEMSSTPEKRPQTLQTIFPEFSQISDTSDSEVACFSNDFHSQSDFPDFQIAAKDSVDVELWNNVLARELEKKNPVFDDNTTIFDESLDCTSQNNEQSSSSSPNDAKSVNLSSTIHNEKLFSNSAPESPKKIVSSSQTNERQFSDSNYYPDFSLSSSSAPVTPAKHNFAPKIDERRLKNSLSKVFPQPEVEEKGSKNVNYYRDSTISVSAPETPQFRVRDETNNADDDSSTCEEASSEPMNKGSAPDTPLSRGNYSVGPCDEDSSTCEEIDRSIDRMDKRSSGHEDVDDEEDRKHLSTPDDERSSDSGFRDKESCEEEESPIPPTSSTIMLTNPISGTEMAARDSSPLSASAEEEQMRILFELDTILDAEYYGSFAETDRIDESLISSPDNLLKNRQIDDAVVSMKNRSISESLESTESIVETVRANSCEPDFLDSRSSRDLASLTSPEIEERIKNDDSEKFDDLAKMDVDDEKKLSSRGNDDDEVEKNLVDRENVDNDVEKNSEGLERFEDFAKLEIDSEKNLMIEGNDDTEADFLVDSISESFKTEKLSSELSTGILEHLRKDSDDFSAKIDSRSNDSSAELRRLTTDTSSSGKFDASNDITDLSFELRSSDATEFLSKSKTTDSESVSPLKSERLNSDELLQDVREETNSTGQTTSKIDDSKPGEIFNNDFTMTIDKRNVDSNICVSPTELKNSPSDSPSKNVKHDEITKICEASTELKNLEKDFPSKMEKMEKENSEMIKKSMEGSSTSQSPRKNETTIASSLPREAPIKLENLENEFPSKIEKLENKNVKTHEASVETKLESPTIDSPLKTDKKPLNSETPEASEPKTENLTSDSSSSSKNKPRENSEAHEASTDPEISTINSPPKSDEKSSNSETHEFTKTELLNSKSDSPLKTDRNQMSDVSMETRGPESVHSDVEQWSSHDNINENENDDEDSSTMSLRSDNSYVSFGLDEEFVTAIRNELREKLPRAQMPVVESLDPRDDEKEPESINPETKRWEDEETDELGDRSSNNVDISIRYNIYGTPLSPILEERESAGTSESLVSKEDSRDDASIASRVSCLSEDVLVVDTRTNRAMMLEGNPISTTEPNNLQNDEDRDTSHGDLSDDENLDYGQNNLTRNLETKRLCMGTGGAPLPSPEEETKWQQQFPLPLQMQDDLMSTSFGTDRDWDSQDEDEGDDDGEDGEDDEEENSSSSGEFVWKRYDESHGDLENVATRSPPNKPKSHEPEADVDEEDEGDDDEDEEEEEEEFTPSAWDATLAPHRSALRSPEKNVKSGDQKKSVWFKKQRYHCVYEYPKENPIAEGHGQTATTWEPTSYADWEEMMDEPRLDVYPMDYDETNRPGDEEFYVSSSNRPFQFQSGEGKYVSQFFPGASSTLLQHQQSLPVTSEDQTQEPKDQVDGCEAPTSPHSTQTNGHTRNPDLSDTQQAQQQLQQQLGELRHTRDRLKLNLLSPSGAQKSEEDSTVENRPPETKPAEISEEKNLNVSKTDEKSSSSSPKNVSNEETELKSNEPTIKNVDDEESMSESEKSSISIDLAVNEASRVKKNVDNDEETSLKTTELMVVEPSDVRVEKSSPSDDSNVISSSNEKSRTNVDQKKLFDANVEFVRDIVVEKNVDMPNVRTDESPASVEKNREVSMTINEGATVGDAVSGSSDDAVKVNDLKSNIVHKSET